ncbi:Methionine aminopeptidase 1D, chloroplastic/mitochondrial [Psilocybe cubensis]|uniref:Methionine aminopeptidase 1D, chloroplastic/mitochondrial n=2 Tax=Psilocybe cubensis TaxID=181762 RepID=A0ACB8H4M9_PSICU|nr:Methionine aminopeptidase 1D, chloroplastic/mitochondrial [Psilocybe cubensis]KAH9482135.1 Methionine aminopeptidase 1D, chloroplastic/mitochondrial [Psilocybe cubensis]
MLRSIRPTTLSLGALFRQQLNGRRASVARWMSTDPVEDHEEVQDFGDYSVILPEEPFVFGVSHIPQRPVPEYIPKPPYALTSDGSIPGDGPRKDSGKIKLGGKEESLLRQAAKLAKKVRDFAGSQVKVGVTTDTIDSAIHNFILAHSAYPSPLRYQGYPKSCCTSINNVIVHGIPDKRPLENGDIINIDITIFLNGYHGDTSQTFLVGDVDGPGRELVQVTNEALELAIAVCGPGKPFKLIGKAIHDFLHNKDYSVSPQFTGHGIGTVFHRTPWIMHHLNDEPGIMEPGHCFTIEPAIIQGTNPRGWIFPDGWTASTENCARSAQAEHMILITETGADVLTR